VRYAWLGVSTRPVTTELARTFRLPVTSGLLVDALTAGIVALVGVSLLTRPERAPQMTSFFDRLQTSSDPPSPATIGTGYGETGPPSHAAIEASYAETRDPLLLVNVLRLRAAAGGRGYKRRASWPPLLSMGRQDFYSHDNKTSNFYDELRERLSPLCRKGRKKGA
jgi:hypothetical protein